MAQPDLKLITTALAAPPFSRTYSVIQLHDEVPVIQLMQLIADAMAAIDEGSPLKGAAPLDMQNEVPEEAVGKIANFLLLLKWKDIGDIETLCQKLLDGDRTTILRILHFLLKDLNLHKKRAYLAPFLGAIDIPAEFSHDPATAELLRQVEELQEQFKEVHKTVDGIRGAGTNAATVKKEIQQLEDEKQQVHSKITNLRKRVEDIPEHEQWLDAAKKLRVEQQEDYQIAERIKEQRSQIQQAESRLAQAQQELRDARNAGASGGPEALFAKMEEDNKMNKYLATENLPKQLEDARQHYQQLQKVLTEPTLGPHELGELESEIKNLNETIAKLAEQRLAKTTKGDDKLSLFRQQAAIILRKKEGTTVRLSAVTEEVNKLTAELEKKKEASEAQGTKMPKGEEFRKYVTDLRTKSTVYKKKKGDISAITAEFGILQRTEEILMNKQKGMEDSLTALEKRHGVAGYHAAQETLEKVSERKAEVDEAKGRTLEEISAIITKLTNDINDKKTVLAPVIQELRTLRQESQELESDYTEKKRLYDATMVGLESESHSLSTTLKTLHSDIHLTTSRYHYLHMHTSLLDTSLDRVMQEMKSYIGGDEQLEQTQKHRGFKTWREMYGKRVAEGETLGRALREQQREVKAKHEPNVKQLAMFQDIKKLLALKIAHNKKVLGGEFKKDQPMRHVTQDRLVL
ncbi:uncharacterized protein EV422DRAFT_563535 [Fimicolochytrium jonesii]|uniref:uncharacterized protein n=1 Tax=Fimicolochytrium jonesii TaxID=1396493 RepID=UPI0022FEA8EE|nr:uncharacterized protein EV422DRAFT_563535 [Fimicolochytrium jonesii]KAI8825704.1 hypothetical protein EV422DRAFT_563535 [Fimicolochytrium jonesii]